MSTLACNTSLNPWHKQCDEGKMTTLICLAEMDYIGSRTFDPGVVKFCFFGKPQGGNLQQVRSPFL
jgi:hypothetical protein